MTTEPYDHVPAEALVPADDLYPGVAPSAPTDEQGDEQDTETEQEDAR